MANKKGCNWVVGCIALVALVLIVGVGLAIYFVPRAFDFIRDSVEKQTEWDAFYAQWQAPKTNCPPDRLFPAKIGTFTLEGHNDQADVTELNIPGVEYGRHARYAEGERHIDVFAYPVSGLEREALVSRVKNATEENFNSRTFWSWNNLFKFSVSPPRQSGALWWHREWLFLVHSRDVESLEPFLREYLEAIGVAATPEETGASE